MGKFYNEIPDNESLINWIKAQQLFHVATAPLNGGHVNVSPKGQPTFKVVNRKAVWYLDLTGSGNETISHLYEPGNGRMTILFEAFEGPPRILRLFGRGKVIERGTPEFDELLKGERGAYDWPTPEIQPGARAIIWLDIEKVGTSCGYSVPYYKFEGHRNALKSWSEPLEKGDREHADPWSVPPKKSLKSYWLHYNTWSMDGMPGFKQAGSRANKDIVRKIMAEAGLSYDDTPAGRGGSSEQWRVLFFGVVLGFLLSAAMHGNVVSVAKQLMHV